MAGSDWADEWQLVNDDGFIYKRPKNRPRIDPHTPSSSSSSSSRAPSSSSSHPLRHDHAAEETILQKRKRAALLNLRNKYQTEIRMWEQLSNTLTATCEKASAHQRTQQGAPVSSSSDLIAGTPEPLADNSSRRIIDDLLAQAEIQGGVIADVSQLCDDAEALCRVQEERLKKWFLDLPIWEKSPHRLISSLSHD